MVTKFLWILVLFMFNVASVRSSENHHHHNKKLMHFTPHRAPYFLSSAYMGFTNQRNVFYGSAILSMLNDWTLVLPNWVIEYDNVTHGETRPFNYFYQINETKLSMLPELAKFRYAYRVPEAYSPACMRQLQCNSFPSCIKPTMDVVGKWIQNSGVACLNAEASYYKVLDAVAKVYNKSEVFDVPALPIAHQFRSILLPSPLYQNISDTILDRMYEKLKTRDFVSVHARIELDFVRACALWTRKGKLRGWDLPPGVDNKKNPRECLVGDAGILASLVSEKVPPSTVVLVMNGQDDDFEFKSLPTVCKMYRCIRKEMLWSVRSAPSELLRTLTSVAMIDAVLASKAIHFFGNVYSTMSLDLYYSRLSSGQKAKMYNNVVGKGF